MSEVVENSVIVYKVTNWINSVMTILKNVSGLKVKLKMSILKSRLIVIQNEKFPNKSWREVSDFYCIQCDALNCDTCPVRFICLTTKDENIVITCSKEEMDKKIEEIRTHRWRLRDGSSRFRENRN